MFSAVKVRSLVRFWGGGGGGGGERERERKRKVISIIPVAPCRENFSHALFELSQLSAVAKWLAVCEMSRVFTSSELDQYLLVGNNRSVIK